MASGSLAGRPQDRRNFTRQGPEHRLTFEDYPQRLRAVVAGRVDSFENARPVTLRAGDQVIARAGRPKLRFETSLAPRAYVASCDIVPGVLVAIETRTRCPYKEQAIYFSIAMDGRRMEDAACSYEALLPAGLEIAGDVCLQTDGIDVDLGEPA